MFRMYSSTDVLSSCLEGLRNTSMFGLCGVVTLVVILVTCVSLFLLVFVNPLPQDFSPETNIELLSIGPGWVVLNVHSSISWSNVQNSHSWVSKHDMAQSLISVLTL